MKIIAISDIHGNIIPIKESADVLIIAGDFSPLYCQQDPIATIGWLDKKLIPWMKRLNVKHFIIVPGNHDFACTYSFFKDDLNTILQRNNLHNRVHYLCRSSVTLLGKKFYGIPDTEGLFGWAFSKQHSVSYDFDHDTDVLITHQPPKVGKVGYVALFNKELGSQNLTDAIARSNICLNVCGHIHTGDHNMNTIRLNNGKSASVYNVSVLDEDYRIMFQPTIIEL